MVVAACAGSVEARAQGAPRPGVDPGPWDHDVHLYRLWRDGSGGPIALFERAGVPSLVRLTDGRLMAAHQWFPENDAASFDRVAVRFSADDGHTWTAPVALALLGLPEDQRPPFDPTLVELPDGRIRLYFTTNGRGPGARPWIASAVSADGLTFVVEPGVRLAVAGEMVIDCAAVRHQGVFHLYAPVQTGLGSAYHATSPDGLTFTRQVDVTMPGVRWLGAALSDGRTMRFYGTGDGGLWTASSADGARWSGAERLVVPGADPGVVEMPDGSRLVLVTGPPRPGTPSASRTPVPPGP